MTGAKLATAAFRSSVRKGLKSFIFTFGSRNKTADVVPVKIPYQKEKKIMHTIGYTRHWFTVEHIL